MNPSATTPTTRRLTKPALTTGQVAALTGLSTRTICKVIDQGLLPGFVIPGSHVRRVMRDDLIAWAKTHGIPLAWHRIEDRT